MQLRGHALGATAVGTRRWSRPLVSAWTLALVALASPWLPAPVSVAAFAAISAGALGEFLVLSPAPRTAPVLYLCVPLQYALVAADAYAAMMLTLPLVATLALPLWSVGSGDVRALAEGSAQRYFGVMLAVYALSHVPALLALGHGLAVFVVALALLGACVQSRVRRAAFALMIAAALGTLGGAALAWLTPFALTWAAAAGAIAGAAAAGGARVIVAAGAPQLAAVAAAAFAAPLLFHYARAVGPA